MLEQTGIFDFNNQDKIEASTDPSHNASNLEPKVAAEPPKKAEAPINMPSKGHTTSFPRTDTAYKKKESIPFDEA